MLRLRLAVVSALVAISGVGCANVDRRVAYRPYRVPKPPAAAPVSPGVAKFFPGLDRSRSIDPGFPPRPDRAAAPRAEPIEEAAAPRVEPIEEAAAPRAEPEAVETADALPVALKVGLDDQVGPPPEVASTIVPRDEAARRTRAPDVLEPSTGPAAPSIAEAGDVEVEDAVEPRPARAEPGKVADDPDATRMALAGRPRLPRLAPPTNLPPDLPPVSYPRSYYDRQPPRMALKPKPALAGERASWRPRIIGRLRDRLSASGLGGDVPKGRQVPERSIPQDRLGEPPER